jgi:type II secretory pathway predicted ATPase ExeA
MNKLKLCEHFNLSYLPFLKPTREAFLYESFTKNQLMLNSIFYTRQMALITGISGSGKTSLTNYSINTLDPSSHRIISCEISNPRKRMLYKLMAIKSGIKPLFYSDDIKLQLIEFFNSENRQGKYNCIIIDEAHTLSNPILDELRCFYEESANFSLILCGLNSLFTTSLNLSVSFPLKRRINIFIATGELSLLETKNYILHHLTDVHCKNNIFDEKCFPIVHSITKGILGRIDQLCYSSMLLAFNHGVAVVTDTIISAASEILNYNN